MDWITSRIAIGNFIDAESAIESELDAILCLKENCCDEKDERFLVSCVPLVDGAGNAKDMFDDAVDFIDDVVSDGERILVHCHAGRSRSVCIVARYLMTRKGMSRDRALSLISGKGEIYLSPGIEEILQVSGR